MHIPGSLTLEAALTVPLFLFFCAAILSFLLILDLQISVDQSLGETARSFGKRAYIYQQGESLISDDPDSGLLQQTGLSPAAVKLRMLRDPGLKEKLDRSRVKGGSSGLYTFSSAYLPEKGILDLVVQYDYRVPWLPGPMGDLRFIQRMRSHVWTGELLASQEEGIADGDGKTVYVTPTGTVYHLSPSCSYLDLSIHEVSSGEAAFRRNASGEKYYACPLCASSNLSGSVYITDYGTNYHSSLSCSGLKRTLIEKDISEVGDMRLCSKCKNGIAHTH